MMLKMFPRNCFVLFALVFFAFVVGETIAKEKPSSSSKEIDSSDSSESVTKSGQTDETKDNEVDPAEKDKLSLERYYDQQRSQYIFGHCAMQPNPNVPDLEDFIWGSIDLRQSLNGGTTDIKVNLTGFKADDDKLLHGFHVHEYGDLSNGCSSAAGHYDPFGVVHGGPKDSPQFRHFGDLGNIKEDGEGRTIGILKDYLVSLLGPFSVLGRAFVVHSGEDDLGRGGNEGSLLTGNAGQRLACCTVGLSDGSRW